MELFKKITFLLFIIFILALFIWALYIPKQDITQTISETLKGQKEKLDLFYKGVSFQEISNGVKYWEIRAKSSSVNNSTGIATLEETDGTFFSKGRPTLKFKAPQAVWHMTKKEIHLINPIGYDAKADEKKLSLIFPENRKGKSYFEFPSRYKGNGEGFFFTAQNLSWNLADQQVVCNDGIWLKKGAISGFSQKLQADVALEKVKISGHPKIQVSDTIPTVLEAVDFEVDNPKNILTARNDVVLTANQIKIETKTATYEQSRDLIKLGDRVSASYRQFKALSDFAVYNLKSQMISLTGKPKLLRGSSMLVGDEVSVNIKKKSFSVKGQSKITIPEKELTEESL